MKRHMTAAAALAGLSGAAEASSLYFGANRPEQYDFADLATLPAEFGRASSPSSSG